MENGKWQMEEKRRLLCPFAIYHLPFSIPALRRLQSSLQFHSPPSRKTAGADARVGREPGQVRKEAALSGPDSVPSSLRSSFAPAAISRARARVRTCLAPSPPVIRYHGRGLG